MGRRSREHKQAVINGKERPFRASPDSPQHHTPAVESEVKPGEIAVVGGSGRAIIVDASRANSLLDRARKLKERQGG